MSAKIAVTVRLRPLSEAELRNGARNSKIISAIEKNEIRLEKIEYRTDKIFKFDKVCSEETSQEQFFQECKMEGFIKKFLSGFNITVFAYGQTGSGKTFTMEGVKYKKIVESNNLQAIFKEDTNRLGIIPRSIFKLFDFVENFEKESKKVRLYCSYMQIYNEKIYDLLDTKQEAVYNPKAQTNPIDLRLRQKTNNDFLVENLSIHPLITYNTAISLFQKGVKKKIMDTHKLNLSSSRSHSIFTIYLEAEEGNKIVRARFDLVDLAGSEKLSIVNKGNEGDQKFQKECIEINKSLFTLKQVINNMAQSQLRLALNKNDINHIPFRDSKLTSILKHSFGGNSYCLMIACLAPLDEFIEENTSTLSYASKASIISNNPSKTEEQQNVIVKALNEKIDHLTRELIFAKKEIEYLKIKNSSDEDKNNLSSTFNTERGKSNSTMDESNSKKSSLNILKDSVTDITKVSNSNSYQLTKKYGNSKSPELNKFNGSSSTRNKSKDEAMNYSSVFSAREQNPLTVKNLRSVINSKQYQGTERKTPFIPKNGGVKPVKLFIEKERGRIPATQRLTPLDRSLNKQARKNDDSLTMNNKSFEATNEKVRDNSAFTTHKRAVSSDPSLLEKSGSQISIAAARSTTGKINGFKLPDRITEKQEFLPMDSGYNKQFIRRADQKSSQSPRMPTVNQKKSQVSLTSSKKNISANPGAKSPLTKNTVKLESIDRIPENPEEKLSFETKNLISHDHHKSTFQFDHEERHHILSTSGVHEGEESESPLDNRNSACYKMDFINKILETLPKYNEEGDLQELSNVNNGMGKNPTTMQILRPKPFSTMRRPEKDNN